MYNHVHECLHKTAGARGETTMPHNHVPLKASAHTTTRPDGAATPLAIGARSYQTFEEPVTTPAPLKTSSYARRATKTGGPHPPSTHRTTIAVHNSRSTRAPPRPAQEFAGALSSAAALGHLSMGVVTLTVPYATESPPGNNRQRAAHAHDGVLLRRGCPPRMLRRSELELKTSAPFLPSCTAP